MSRKFYISDLHIGHENILKHDSRPFRNLDEMEQTIIRNWNNAVKNNDEVYVLGDMFWKNDEALTILPQLAGRKYLILGNHDRLNAQMRSHFERIKEYDSIRDNGRHVILFHYPIAHWRNSDYGTIHLFGHIHNGRDNRPFNEYIKQMKEHEFSYECYNVGCMLPYMNYTPRTLDEIISGCNNIQSK